MNPVNPSHDARRGETPTLAAAPDTATSVTESWHPSTKAPSLHLPLQLLLWVALAFPACGVGRETAAAAGSEQPSPSTGIPECDRYVAMIEQCLPQMPNEDRVAARFAVDQIRALVPTMAQRDGDAMARQCAENVESALRTNTYGCHDDAARAAGVLSPCDLVTREELERILGGRFADAERDGTTCTYPPVEGSMRFVEIDVAWSGGAEEMAAWRSGAGMVDRALEAASGEDVDLQDDLAGLGDEALFTMGMLQVRQGDAFFSLHAFGSSEAGALTVARKILSRLP